MPNSGAYRQLTGEIATAKLKDSIPLLSPLVHTCPMTGELQLGPTGHPERSGPPGACHLPASRAHEDPPAHLNLEEIAFLPPHTAPIDNILRTGSVAPRTQNISQAFLFYCIPLVNQLRLTLLLCNMHSLAMAGPPPH